ncbi:MAG: hypothetical protein OZ934_12465 [Anaerolineae bacterium]|nr:hypothetical protein [Anaerolineae bacterium]
MPEPRITLLPQESGRTFAFSGMVIVRESKAFFERVFSALPQIADDRAFELVLAVCHEMIHVLQALSTAFLYSYSVAIVQRAFEVLDHLDVLLKDKGRTTAFAETYRLLEVRHKALSVRDLLEGVAVLESYKLAAPTPSALEFLALRERLFPGDSTSCYRISYDYLAARIGPFAAFDLLAPLSFLALQSDDPPSSFQTIVDDLLPRTRPEHLAQASVADLFTAFGMSAGDHLLYNLDSMPQDMRHPVVYECARFAAATLGVPTLLEIGARPALINRLDPALGATETLLPPVIAFSSSPNAKLEALSSGLASQDPALAELIVHLTGLVGAAERLTVFRDASDLHQFCPHRTTCPHFAAALCHHYFAPPSLELGYAHCGFIRFFEGRTHMKPNQAWAALNA